MENWLLLIVIKNSDDKRIYQKNIQWILYIRINHDGLNQIKILLNESAVEYVVQVNIYVIAQWEDK